MAPIDHVAESRVSVRVGEIRLNCILLVGGVVEEGETPAAGHGWEGGRKMDCEAQTHPITS